MQEHHIRVAKTARYYTWGAPPREAEFLWIACHGYGQLARRFIRRFDQLDAGKHLIVAPEGLSRFYWQGYNDQPVASWMTREDRLHEIQDYCDYLDTLLQHVEAQCPTSVQKIGFGFSQGVATIMRWMTQRRPDLDRLVAWAGSPPDDIRYAPYRDYLDPISKHYLHGDQDLFLPKDRLEMLMAFSQEQGLDWEVTTFQGDHRIDRDTLQSLVASW
jgi:predicted esterase